MNAETSCINTKALINYVKGKNPENLHLLFQPLEDAMHDVGDPEAFLSDANNWISIDLCRQIMEQTKRATSDEMATYKAGFESIRQKKLGYIERIFVRALFTPKHAIRRAQKINAKFNKSKSVEIISSSNSHALIRLHWFNDMPLTRDFCSFNKGVYAAMSCIWDLPPARLEEKTCYFKGGPYCEYEMWWDKKSLWKLLFRRSAVKREVLDSLIKEMERDKELLKQKYKQVAKLNVELEKKVASLMSLQEASQAVVSILDEQTLIQTIMNLLTWVIGFEMAILFLADEKQEKLHFAQAVGAVDDLVQRVKGYEIPLNRMTNILVRVAATGTPRFVKDVESSNLRKGNVILDLFQPQNFAAAPLIARNKVIGVLAGELPREHADMTETDLNLLMTFSNHIAIAIENARLYRDLERTYRSSVQAQKMEAIGTLAGGVAHDFNNILQAILGNISLLLYDLGNDEHRHYGKLKQIEKSGQRATDLVRQLLTFSRKGETQPRPLSLNFEVKEVKKLLSSTIPKMIDIELELDPKLRTIDADPVQVNQILMNLAVNARDAMPDGGKLVVGTENVVLDEDFCRNHPGLKPGWHVMLWVSDTGHGMEKSTKDHVFEPFFTTKESGKGTGLGLSTVYGIVKSHRGHIVCESERGAGTKFSVYFPALSKAGEDLEEPKRKETISTRGTETILFVDDETDTRQYGKDLLEQQGYTVLTAGSGEAALEIFAQERKHIDLVILDLIMAGMGGKRCLNEILKLEPETKVLIITGYAESEAVKEALHAGAREILTKPFRSDEIAQMIRGILDEKHRPATTTSLPSSRRGLRVVSSK